MCSSVIIELTKPGFLWFCVSAAPQPLQTLVCYNSTPTIVFIPVVFPLCNAVNPELLPLQVFSLLCVLTGWLLNLSNCALGHGHLNWVCLKCILFEYLRYWCCSFCLCIPETRKSACGVVYTVKKPRKVEEEETAVPACKKAKTQAWWLNQLSTGASFPSLPSVGSSLLPCLACRRIILPAFKWGKLCEWDAEWYSPHLKGHAGLLAKVRRLILHPALGLLELMQTQQNISNMEIFTCMRAFLFY